jgi:hypothetical protein
MIVTGIQTHSQNKQKVIGTQIPKKQSFIKNFLDENSLDSRKYFISNESWFYW